MKTIIFLAALMAVSAPAHAEQKYTCADVRAKSCRELKFLAYWKEIPIARQVSIARRCGVSHCLVQ